jgi:hypothetical protein
MRIKFAIILEDYRDRAFSASERLETAVQDGEMLNVDLISEELVSLCEKDNSIFISEDYWHRFVSSVRKRKPVFKTNYLFDVAQSQEILELGLNREFPDITSVFEIAAGTGSLVLQLPVEEAE